jgi:hypothetical protein
MHSPLSGLSWIKCLRGYFEGMTLFYYDILLYSKNWDDHLLHMWEVLKILKILRVNQLFVRREKCQFGQDTICYLGHVIFEHGVAMDLETIVAMVEWTTPTSVEALRFFWTNELLQKIYLRIWFYCGPTYTIIKERRIWVDKANI